MFQPHRYTRTRTCCREFAHAPSTSPTCSSLTDIYAAGEAPIAGVHERDLADGIAAHGHREVLYMDGDRQGIVDYLCESTRSGDLVLTLGAGDVGQLGAELLARLGDGTEQPNRR